MSISLPWRLNAQVAGWLQGNRIVQLISKYHHPCRVIGSDLLKLKLKTLFEHYYLTIFTHYKYQ